uniref:Uncharacterized protein n=1 Tax=Panagrolaimus superbus TaxID=310955 RepID=A0A914Y3M0_9BILA
MCNCSMAWLINDLMSPTHTINLKSIGSQGSNWGHAEFKCAAPYVLKNVPFIQLSKHFCPNEAKKDRKIVAVENITSTVVPTTESPSSEFAVSRFHIGITVILSALSFIFGISIFPVFRYCFRRSSKKNDSGFTNQKFS